MSCWSRLRSSASSGSELWLLCSEPIWGRECCVGRLLELEPERLEPPVEDGSALESDCSRWCRRLDSWPLGEERWLLLRYSFTWSGERPVLDSRPLANAC